jgi:hypothetical protein
MADRTPTLLLVSLVTLVTSVRGFSANSLQSTRIVKPCAASAAARPVLEECAAAAIAERAFLKDMIPKKHGYTIIAIAQTEPEWRFLILLGDAQHPPGPGEHYFVLIDRQTGAVTLIPGK